MPTLFVKCRSCPNEFPTPIAVTEAGLGGVLITNLTHRCPECGQENQYSTNDYFVPRMERTDSPAGEEASVGGDRAAEAGARQDAEVDRLEGYGVQRTPHGERSGPPAPAGGDAEV